MSETRRQKLFATCEWSGHPAAKTVVHQKCRWQPVDTELMEMANERVLTDARTFFFTVVDPWPHLNCIVPLSLLRAHVGLVGILITLYSQLHSAVVRPPP